MRALSSVHDVAQGMVPVCLPEDSRAIGQLVPKIGSEPFVIRQLLDRKSVV